LVHVVNGAQEMRYDANVCEIGDLLYRLWVFRLLGIFIGWRCSLQSETPGILSAMLNRVYLDCSAVEALFD